MNKQFRAGTLVFAIAFIISLLMSFALPGTTPAAAPYDQLASSVLQKNYSLYQAGKAVDGQWGNFGSYDAYVFKQAGIDVSSWVYGGSSFKSGIIGLIDATLAAESGAKKSSQRAAQDYLAAKSIGETGKAGQLLGILQARQTVSGNVYFDNNAFSDIAALELLGRAGDLDKINQAGAINYILGKQESGAWPPAADWGPDFMCTAQAVRALKYLDPQGQQAAVVNAINSGSDWLKSKQKSNGSFLGNVWEDPATDSAEVIATLKLLGIDPASWSSGGKTAMDYLLAAGSYDNISSNTWALDACLKLGAATTNNSGSSGGSSSETKDTINVSAKVVGKNGEVLFGPEQLTLRKDQFYGFTALGALQATGLGWSFSPQFNTLVDTIAGQKNEGMCGWMFKINDSVPVIPARDAALAQGDRVIWWYSSDAGSLGPSWDGMVNLQKASLNKNLQEIKEALNTYTTQLNQIGLSTVIKNAEQRMSPQQLEALQKELDENNVALKDQEVGTIETVLTDKKQEIVLCIPEKAFNETKKLSVQELASVPRAGQYGHKIISSLYEFSPNGTVFANPATISLRVPITEDMDIGRLTPAWYDEKKLHWVPIPGIIDLKESRVVFNTNHFTDFALIELPARISFKDIDEELDEVWDAVEILAGQGIVKGTGQGFEPQRSINRAEVAQLLVEALGLVKVEETKLAYKDVGKSDWFARAVKTACAHKIMTGYSDLTFRPAQKINRYELASIIYKLDEENMTDYKLICKDKDNIPAWAVNGVKYLERYNLMKDAEDGSFQGEKPVTRAEAALVLFKYFNL